MSTDPAAATPPAPALLSGRVEFLSAARRVVMEARYGLSLLSDELDPRVFGHESFADAVRHFALLNRHARMRVLVTRPQRAAKGPHSLLDLGRTLPSRVEFREVSSSKAIPAHEWLIADGRLLLERSAADALESRLDLENPMAARERQRKFDHYWNEGSPSLELRRLRV